eukprot:TRINITY_DN18612_c0_g1_i1.p1 TRINITY_DN18612_c0_g1~~TRINITY_DN18612_c0_g1_i1.p1  ORF type:complete len:122 (-),score=56.37 TRINITY_DN18612_c0_g1_i1:124-489(-)
MASSTGRLTTHVLDTVRGKPADGIRIELYRLDAAQRTLLKTVTTNSNGRTDEPLLADGALAAATYELEFFVHDYFTAKAIEQASPAFLDVVPLRFTVADSGLHYHVPLLVSPWSYSTYRGS